MLWPGQGLSTHRQTNLFWETPVSPPLPVRCPAKMLSGKRGLPFASKPQCTSPPAAASPPQPAPQPPSSRPGPAPPAPPAAQPEAPARSHQSGTIAHHWNDLPAAFLSAPSSRNISRSASPLPPAPAPASSSCPPTPISAEPRPGPSPSPSLSLSPRPDPGTGTGHGDADGDAGKELELLLLQLFAPTTASTLGAGERRQLHERVARARLTPAQSAELVLVLRPVLAHQQSPAWGRERVVAFVVRNSGVAGWAGALRRGVESLVS